MEKIERPVVLYDAPHCRLYTLILTPCRCLISLYRVFTVQGKQDPPLLCISLLLLQAGTPPCCCSTGPSDPPGNCCCCWTIDRTPARLPTSQHIEHCLRCSQHVTPCSQYPSAVNSRLEMWQCNTFNGRVFDFWLTCVRRIFSDVKVAGRCNMYICIVRKLVRAVLHIQVV